MGRGQQRPWLSWRTLTRWPLAPKSAAICVLSSPLTTSPTTARPRAVSESKPAAQLCKLRPLWQTAVVYTKLRRNHRVVDDEIALIPDKQRATGEFVVVGWELYPISPLLRNLCADHALDVGILPRTSWGGPHFFDAYIAQPLPK
jgi:hypothetical protein